MIASYHSLSGHASDSTRRSDEATLAASGAMFASEQPACILVHAPALSRSPADKPQVRKTIHDLVNLWIPDAPPPVESCTGPVYPKLKSGARLALSISYSEKGAWLAFSNGFPIGIDAVDLATVHALGDVTKIADTYLPLSARESFRNMSGPLFFARLWSAHEASLKCFKLPLDESPVAPPAKTHNIEVDDTVLAVAFPNALDPVFL